MFYVDVGGIAPNEVEQYMQVLGEGKHKEFILLIERVRIMNGYMIFHWSQQKHDIFYEFKL